MKATCTLLLLLVLGGLCNIQAQSVHRIPYFPMLEWDSSPYHSFQFKGGNNEKINFRLLFPNGYDSSATDGKKHPLTIILHGTGESGRMEWNNSTKTNTPYPAGDERIENNDHQLLFGGLEHLNARNNGQFDGFVLFPQNFYGSWTSSNGDAQSDMHRDLKAALELLEYLVANLLIDPDRLIIQGISNGGVGAWYAAYRRPELFAGLMPMSAHGDPAMASKVAPLPIWVFQGQDDTNPPPPTTEKTIDAIIKAGGKVNYTIYPETSHNTWNKAYREPEFFNWMMSQNRKDHRLNKFPVVDAGKRQVILIPKDSTVLEGTASDEDGRIISSSWEKVSGPAATLHQPNSLVSKISDLQEGTYIFRLTAVDEIGARRSSEVTVIVTPVPLAVHPEKLMKEMVLYPNPFSEEINIKWIADKPQNLVVTLLNLQGKSLYTTIIAVQTAGEQVITIPIENISLPNGLCFIQFRSKELYFIKKMVVKRE